MLSEPKWTVTEMGLTQSAIFRYRGHFNRTLLLNFGLVNVYVYATTPNSTLLCPPYHKRLSVQVPSFQNDCVLV